MAVGATEEAVEVVVENKKTRRKRPSRRRQASAAAKSENGPGFRAEGGAYGISREPRVRRQWQDTGEPPSLHSVLVTSLTLVGTLKTRGVARSLRLDFQAVATNRDNFGGTAGCIPGGQGLTRAVRNE